MKILLLAITVAGAAAVLPPASGAPGVLAASPAVTADTVDSLYRLGRQKISEGRYVAAAEYFARVHDGWPSSKLAGDAFYWEAFALYRTGDPLALRMALDRLEEQAADHATASTVKSGESRTLATRIRGVLARTGDARAAESISGMAETIAGSVNLGTEVARLSLEATAAAMKSPETQRALDQARAELAREMNDPAVRAEIARAQRELAGVDREVATTARAGATVRGATAGGRSWSAGDVPPGCEAAQDDERMEALNALLQMQSEQAMPILTKVMARRDKCSELLRRKAVFLVSQKRSTESADLLLKAATDDPDREVRRQAVFWLSQVRDDRAEGFLIDLLKDGGDAELQEQALFSLSQRRSPRAAAALRAVAERPTAGRELRERAIFQLGQQRSPENAEYLRGLFGKLNDDELRERALFSLSQMRGLGNETWLLERAGDAQLPLELRKKALFWAGQMGASTPAIAAFYPKAGDREMKEQVIFVLSQQHKDAAAAVEKLIEIARGEKDVELRKKAVFWLGQSRDPRAAAFLAELISK